MKSRVGHIAMLLAILAVVVTACTVPGLKRGLRESVAAGGTCVLAVVLALSAAVLGSMAAADVRPVPRMAWGAIFISTLVIVTFLLLLHT